MATIALYQSPYWKSVRGAPWSVTLPEAAAQTFVKGELVNLAAGLVQRIAAAGGPALSTDVIGGPAATPATGTTNTPIAFFVLDDAFWVGLPCLGAAGAGAATADTQIGTKYELYHTATAGVYGYDTTETTDLKVIPQEFVVNGHMAKGDTRGHALCKFIAAQRLYG